MNGKSTVVVHSAGDMPRAHFNSVTAVSDGEVWKLEFLARTLVYDTKLGVTKATRICQCPWPERLEALVVIGRARKIPSSVCADAFTITGKEGRASIQLVVHRIQKSSGEVSIRSNRPQGTTTERCIVA